jgi:hypothetical protein
MTMGRLLRAESGRPGRLIATATRWVIILWSALHAIGFACLIDIMGLGWALSDFGFHWLVGVGAIQFAAAIARLIVWVGRDLGNGLRTEAESLIRCLVLWRPGKRIGRRSGVWDEWLDGRLPVGTLARTAARRAKPPDNR